MNQQEVASIVKGISAAVLVNVSKALGQFSERIVALEQRMASVRDGRDGADGRPGPMGERGEAVVGPAGAAGVDGAPGRDADEALVLSLDAEVKSLRTDLAVLKLAPTATLEADEPPDVEALVKAAVAQLPLPRDGRDGQDGSSVTLDELRPVVASAVSEAVAVLPAAKDGAPGRDVDMADVQALVIKAVAQFPIPKDGNDGAIGAPGIDGKDGAPAVIDMTVVGEMVSEHVKTTLSVWPQPKDGASVTVEDVRPMIAGEVQKAVAAIPPARDGKDGIGVAGVLIDREGKLVATLSDGTVKACGIVVGRDGRDADMDAIEKHIAGELEKWPRPKDGEPGAPGAPGRDGTLEDVKFVQSDDFRTVTVCRKDGAPIDGGTLTFPVVIDRGVFKAGDTYQPGDGVTWAGSFWIAQRDTSGKPGEGDSGYRLAVKRGGDGKEGKAGINGKDGAPGPPGRDGTKTW